MSTSSAFRIAFIALLAVCVPASHARAQSTALVPSSDLVYVDIDQLSELGVLDSVIIGQRPYSRREIARIARVARGRLLSASRPSRGSDSEKTVEFAERLLDRIEAFAGDEESRTANSSIFALDGASLSAASTNENRRTFLTPSAKTIEGTIGSLGAPRLGKPADHGAYTALEVSHRFEAASWLAVQARERIQYSNAREGHSSSTVTGELLLASVRARVRNAALTVGRQQLTWSQSAGDGLFLNANAPALDMISVAGDRPFVMPGVLRYLGPTQATFLVANLGASVVRSHSRLLSYKVSIQPWSDLELGGIFMNHFGGEGGRETSVGNRIIDFLPFIDVFRTHNYTDTTKTLDVDSDKVAGFDGRWHLRPLGGITLVGEMLIDDFDPHRLPKLLTGYGSQSIGIIVPYIGTPQLSAKLSAKHMGFNAYTHFALTQGLTTHGRLLGDELGADAKRYSVQGRWDATPDIRLDVEGRASIHSNASYTGFYTDPEQTKFVVKKLSKTADELREVVLASITIRRDARSALTFRAGAERVRNEGFQGGRRRSYVAEVAFRIGQ